jgi:tellurite resistance protein TerC
MRIDPQYYGHKFFIRKGNKVSATLLLLVLVVIESTDVIFAVDSIPAILGISKDPFIVYTSNVFAILGLRALYFALAGIIDIFQYLKYGLAIVLTFIGAKMILEIVYEIPLMISLGIIAGILIISAILSIVIPPKKN